MTSQQMVATAIRLFAVWLGLSGIFNAISILFRWGGMDWMIAVGLLFYILICILIWKFPLTIANKIVPRVPEQAQVNLSALSIAQVVVSIMGLWFIASGVVSIMSGIVSGIHYFFGASSNFQSLPIQWKLFIGAKLVSVIAGAILMSNSTRIARACIGVRWNDRVDENNLSA